MVAPAWRGCSFRLIVPVAAAIGLAAFSGGSGSSLAVASELSPELRTWTRGPVPALELDVLDGARASLAGQGGGVVLVHFFATWCEPCRAEMAALRRLAADPPARPLTILAVDVGEVDARVRRFFEADPLPFPILMDRDRAATRRWGIVALPSTVVLDAALNPRLIVEADLDWDDADIRRTLAALAGAMPPQAD